MDDHSDFMVTKMIQPPFDGQNIKGTPSYPTAIEIKLIVFIDSTKCNGNQTYFGYHLKP